jgi:Ca-activated chloride channel family protein
VIHDVPRGDDGKPVPAVIVLLSDGSTTVGTPTADAIPIARKAKVPVWTIAYGTPDGVIDVTLPDTGETARVQVPVDHVALENLARGTGGRSFMAESAADLSAVYKKMGSSIGYENERREVTWRYLVAAVAAMGAAGAASVLLYQRLP